MIYKFLYFKTFPEINWNKSRNHFFFPEKKSSKTSIILGDKLNKLMNKTVITSAQI